MGYIQKLSSRVFLSHSGLYSLFEGYRFPFPLFDRVQHEDPRRGSLNVAHREPASNAKTGVTVGTGIVSCSHPRTGVPQPIGYKRFEAPPFGGAKFNLHVFPPLRLSSLRSQGSRWATFRNSLREFSFPISHRYVRLRVARKAHGGLHSETLFESFPFVFGFVLPLRGLSFSLPSFRRVQHEDPRRGSLNVAHREPASNAKTGVTVGTGIVSCSHPRMGVPQTYFQRYCSSNSISYLRNKHKNSSRKDHLLWCSAWLCI